MKIISYSVRLYPLWKKKKKEDAVTATISDQFTLTQSLSLSVFVCHQVFIRLFFSLKALHMESRFVCQEVEITEKWMNIDSVTASFLKHFKRIRINCMKSESRYSYCFSYMCAMVDESIKCGPWVSIYVHLFAIFFPKYPIAFATFS